MDKGFILCCTGKDIYFSLCNTLIRDIREVMGYSIHIAVYTDQPERVVNANLILNATKKADPNKSFLTKIYAIQSSPFAKSIFLDVDCRLLRPVDEIFTILERNDFILCYADGKNPMRPEAWDPSESGIPLSTSTMGFKKSPAADELFINWERDYIQGLYFPGKGDQSYLSRLLYLSDVRVSILPCEYRLNTNLPQTAGGIIKIITGHICDYDSNGRISLAKLDSCFNRTIGIRLLIFSRYFILGNRHYWLRLPHLLSNGFLFEYRRVSLKNLLRRSVRQLYKLKNSF
jgi:hypothetical protein